MPRRLPRRLPCPRQRHADAKPQGDRPVLAAGCGLGGVDDIRGTAAAVDPGQGPKLADITAGDSDGDRLQIRGAPDPDRAAAARTAGGRDHCGGDPLDAGLEQQREGTALLGDRDGAAGAPDLLDRERGHPGVILRQVANSHSGGATAVSGSKRERVALLAPVRVPART